MARNYGTLAPAVSALSPSALLAYLDPEGKRDRDGSGGSGPGNAAFAAAVARLKARTGRDSFPLQDVITEMQRGKT